MKGILTLSNLFDLRFTQLTEEGKFLLTKATKTY